MIKLQKYSYLSHKYLILDTIEDCFSKKDLNFMHIPREEIGYIEFIRKDKIIIITYLHIYTSYRHKHYGYQVIDYLFSYYKFKCIVGETLKESRGFWNKCIRKYNGMRRNIYYSDNCTSLFVIPRQKINYKQIWDLLDYSYNIIY